MISCAVMPYPGVDIFVGEREVAGKVGDDVSAKLGVDVLAGDVAEPVVEDAAGEVVGPMALR